MMKPLERQFLDAIRALWSPGTPLVVGVSGGIDSMALFALIQAVHRVWPTRYQAVHVDHGIRPEAAEDAAWLAAYLAEVFSHSLKVATVSVRPEIGESLEMAARRERYRALFSVAQSMGEGAVVAVAHQKNDQAETVLMRVIAGTGVRGLAAMRPLGNGVVRPLLGFSRDQLQQYLEHRGLRWREDPTNQDVRMLRNRIRHQVLPILAEINPSVQDALAGLAERAARHEQALESMLDGWISDQALEAHDDVLTLAAEWAHWPRELTALVLRRYAESQGVRLSARHLDLAFRGGADWPGGFRVEHLSDGRLRVAREGAVAAARDLLPAALPEAGSIKWSGRTIEVEPGRFLGPRAGWSAIDAKRWPRLWVRGWRPGDRMRPLGLEGHSKKVQDIFTDAKIARDHRATWPLVASDPDDGVILAVLGVAAAEDARSADAGPVHWIRSIP